MDAAHELDVDLAVIMAVARIESAGDGFLKGTDLPKILFEGHWFHRHTDGKFSDRHPSISYKSWTKAHYKGGRGEYDRLVEAISINDSDATPALLSTSWGRFQIMGFNHRIAGYETITEFVNDMSMSEEFHLKAFIAFIKSKGLDDELRKKEWADFAFQYNGKGYKKNKYDIKMASEFARLRKRFDDETASGEILPERQDVIALQAALNVAVGEELEALLSVDGWLGNRTRQAIRVFRRSVNLSDKPIIDADLCAALDLDIPSVLEA
ncbi:MAG: N-acetylmuramidase family protein [Pseudomonadota bacterium]